jgi:hypothetical protein
MLFWQQRSAASGLGGKCARPSLACVLASIPALLAVAVCAAGVQVAKIVEYKEVVPLSSGQIRDGNTCVYLGPAMSAGEFFDGLQRTESANGDVFRKNAQVVQTFPDAITVQVQVGISVCNADIYTPAPAPSFVNGMQFKVQWKRGLVMRPVAQLRVQRIPFMAEEGDNRMLFVLKIHDKDVPLTDHLIVSVISPQGKLLSRMAGRL